MTGESVGGSERAMTPERAAEVAVRHFLDAVDAGDEMALADLFTADASAYLPFADSAGLIEGRGAIIARFARLIAAWRRRGLNPPFVGFDPKMFGARPLGVDWMLATFQLDIAGDTGRRTVLLRSTDQGWRIFHLHASNLGPPARG
jgi:ketosteroid isomerase-like protein